MGEPNNKEVKEINIFSHPDITSFKIVSNFKRKPIHIFEKEKKILDNNNNNNNNNNKNNKNNDNDPTL